MQSKQHHNINTAALKINSVCCRPAVLTADFAQICSNSCKPTTFGSCGHFWVRSGRTGIKPVPYTCSKLCAYGAMEAHCLQLYLSWNVTKEGRGLEEGQRGTGPPPS